MHLQEPCHVTPLKLTCKLSDLRGNPRASGPGPKRHELQIVLRHEMLKTFLTEELFQPLPFTVIRSSHAPHRSARIHSLRNALGSSWLGSAQRVAGETRENLE